LERLQMANTVRRVLVTGANGNLGGKLIRTLLAGTWCESAIAVDRNFADDRLPDDTRLARIAGDLRDGAGAWRGSFGYVDAVVHLAAQNPYPDASWADCVASVDMTLNVAQAAADHAVQRLVFASSNHVMGGYKETAFASKPGALKTDLDPMPGTQYRAGGAVHGSPAYAVAKLMGERILATKAEAGGLSAVSLRIGWCQPGANHPATISASGVPGAEADPADLEAAHDLRWFRQMWLSDRDYSGVVEAALRADAAEWPFPAIVVNAMSANAGTPWDLAPTRTLIGYKPADDVWAELGLDPPM
jgi:nucleoside-diphosphate-sugar epimerase